MPEIRSPLPGTFYRAAAPDQPPFKDVGDAVAAGDVVGLIEVMKTFVEVQAEVAGRITAFLAENGEPIAPGDVVAELE